MLGPRFTRVPNVELASLGTANTNRDGTGTIATVLTAGAEGTKIPEIKLKASSDPADCTVVFYIHDGSNFWAFDEYDMGNPAAGSATVASFQASILYDNLVLEPGWTLRASITATPTAGVVYVIALGGDYEAE